MDDNTTLLEKREELKREVTARLSKTLPALILNTTGCSISNASIMRVDKYSPDKR